MKKIIVFACLVLLIAVSQAGANSIIDQISPAVNATFNTSNPSYVWQQEVLVGISGLLSGIDLYWKGDGGGHINFYLNDGSAWQTDTNDFETLINLTVNGWNHIDVSSAGMYLASGDQFVIGLHGTGDGTWIMGNYDNITPFYPGDLYFNGNPHTADRLWKIGFQSYINPVPEPSTILLLGAGLAGIGLLRRRFKN